MHAATSTKPSSATATLAAMVVLAIAYIILHQPPPFEPWVFRELARLSLRQPGIHLIAGIGGTLAALALLLSAMAAALRLSRRLDGSTTERCIVFGVWTFALIVVPAAWIGAAGSAVGSGLLRPPVGPLLSALPSLLVAWRTPSRGRSEMRVVPAAARVPAWRTRPLVIALAACVLVAIGVSALSAVTHPPTGYLALMYQAPLSAMLWLDGNITGFLDRAPQNVTLAHPLAGELWNGVLLLIGGEKLANLTQLPFAVLGAAAVAALAMHSGLGHRAAQLGAVAFLSMPMVIAQVGIQQSGITAAALLISALSLAAAPGYHDTMRLASIGTALGLAATTKLAVVPAVAAIGVSTLAMILWSARTTTGSSAGMHETEARARTTARVAILACAFLLAVSPWWGRNLLRYHNPLFPADLPFVGLGRPETEMTPKDPEFVPSKPAWLLYPLRASHNDHSGFGALFAIGALPGLFIAARRGRPRPIRLCLALVGVTLPAWWLMTRHEPRFLIACVGSLYAFTGWTLTNLDGRKRVVGALVLGAMGVFSVALTITHYSLPRAIAPQSRTAFYAREWGVDEIVATLPEDQGILLQTGYGPTTYPAYYPLMGPTLRRLVLTMDLPSPTNVVVERMRSHGVRLAYVVTSPENEDLVKSLYDSEHFDVMRLSVVDKGPRKGTRRYLFALKEQPHAPAGVPAGGGEMQLRR